MKRVSVFASLIVLALTGCGNTSDDTAANQTTTTTQKTTATSKTTTEKQATTTKKTTTKKSSYSDDDLKGGEYWCMGKNDTCKNKTKSPYDLYCHSCDPDDNNIEGDQR